MVIMAVLEAVLMVTLLPHMQQQELELLVKAIMVVQVAILQVLEMLVVAVAVLLLSVVMPLQILLVMVALVLLLQ